MNAKVGYLISRYPSISHTFILREVLQLRRLGFDIHVASINECDRKKSDLTCEEAAEVESVFYVKRQGLTGGCACPLCPDREQSSVVPARSLVCGATRRRRSPQAC